ncbi:adenylosuccinate synthetase [Opitutus terrae]|uniref:Adenylosuccinate synthetase n=1 Tax=Opitutus terrae (strain DSM 11246 / JCM 15787 / PB90-1) TaxID=452637 RepID=B1ZW71_OPITP|nr:adenylosuccinate synthetase [Opitutus terrae]ACB76085.1 Adenylosuccinate synthase [Opitutus terrae PB90-1]
MSLLPFSSQIIADVGISLGDEGKGRLIPEVADELRSTPAAVSVVLKVNGGANSGHTAGGIKLNLLPAGVVVRDAPHLCVGSGVVADPRKIWWETRPLEAKGHPVLARLLIDERTLVSDLTHRLLDLAWEDYRTKVLAEEPRGSTGRGITPAYLDEVGQWQITYADFLGGPNYFARKLAQRADRALRTIQHVCRVAPETFAEFFDKLTAAELRANAEAIEMGVFPREEFDFTRFRGAAPFSFDLERLTSVYWNAGTALAKNIGEVRELVLRELHAGHTIIGEFGQAYWLDKRHGFSPNVTASHTYTPEFFQSAGVPVQRIHTFGVAKAYDTKVGTHTFLTQMDDAHPLAQKLKQLEFGTSTGRQRMVGWFDAVEKGDVLRYGGFQDVMINKSDALTYSGEWRGDLQICVAYEDASGKRYAHVPRNEAVRKTLRPVYTKHPGWAEDISHVRHFAKLPRNAQRYVAAMMKSLLDVAYEGAAWPAADKLPNLRYLGVGPEPSQIIKDVPATAQLVKLG